MKRRITLEVETGQFFDVVRKMNGNTNALGQRFIELLLAPVGYVTSLGLAVYGVTVVEDKPVNN